MKFTVTRRTAAYFAVAALGFATSASADDKVVKIGVLNDMSSLYADATGPGSVAAAKMAIADFTRDHPEFKVELILIDDPVAMRDAYAAGKVHIGWATLDMVPLFMEELKKDSRIMPRIYQQVDWSNGGDGIVVRLPVD